MSNSVARSDKLPEALDKFFAAPPASPEAVCKSAILTVTLCVPDEACSTFLAISDVAIARSSAAEAIEFAISVTLTMVSPIEQIAVAAPSVAV